MMDSSDRKILENRLAVPLGRAISQWMKQNEVDAPVTVDASITFPSCYIDENGVSHVGPLVVCDIHILDDDVDGDEY